MGIGRGCDRDRGRVDGDALTDGVSQPNRAARVSKRFGRLIPTATDHYNDSGP
jgi:hypothetical protein